MSDSQDISNPYQFEQEQKKRDKTALAELYELHTAETDPSKKEDLMGRIDNLLRAARDPNAIPDAMMDLGDEGSATNPIRVGPPTVVPH